jgi:hypothetical protein
MARTIECHLGKFVFRATLGRRPDQNLEAYTRKLSLGYCRSLEARFPELQTFGFKLTEENASDVTAFYAAYLPLVRDESRSAATRSMLKALMDKSQDESVKRAAATAIAKSDLDDGMAERALAIRHLQQWIEETDAWERAYGAPIITTDWKKAQRGASLRMFFSAHPHLIVDKDVLHVAPEPELEMWLKADAGARQYVSTDGQFAGVTEHHDITSLGYPSESFDVVICHRVMEHVLDDEAGFSELFRVLRPGGLLNFSVPQAPQRPKTKEWAVPDQSHDGHVRQYGADLLDRIRAAGFTPQIEPWLLSRSHEELRAAGAYPMRILNCYKPF